MYSCRSVVSLRPLGGGVQTSLAILHSCGVGMIEGSLKDWTPTRLDRGFECRVSTSEQFAGSTDAFLQLLSCPKKTPVLCILPCG